MADFRDIRHSRHGVINDITDTQAAYLAGMIDADGCIGIGMRNTGNAMPRVIITNGYYELIVKIKDIVGAGCSYRAKTRATRKDQNERNWNPVHRWQITGIKAQSLLKRILPYMIVKRQQAKLVIECPLRNNGYSETSRPEWAVKKQNELFEKCKLLNARGAQLFPFYGGKLKC